MEYKNLFSEDEWQSLQSSFELVFQLVAGADRKVDRKEKKAFEVLINHSDNIKDKLISEIAADLKSIKNNFEARTEEMIINDLKEISIIIDKRLIGEKAASYKKILVAIGIYIAKASGDLFGSKMSELEEDAIKNISKALNISIEELQTKPSVVKILRKIEEDLKRFY